MRRRAGDPMKGRVAVDALVRYAKAISDAKPSDPRKEVEKKSRVVGERIRSCTVRGFYEPFIVERVSNEEDFESEQEWLDYCIEAALGLDFVPGLTMGDLASRIAERMQQDDLSDEDRWVLYELCFFLTAQMARPDEQFFSHRQQCTRLGPPDENEPDSLYCRAIAHRRKAMEGTAPAGSKVRVSIDELIGKTDGHTLSERTRSCLPELKIGPVMDCLLIAKYHLNTDNDLDEFCLLDSGNRFAEMFEMYTRLKWSRSNTITDIASMMTWMFWLNVRNADSNVIERARVLQAYELCYEFINAFASAEHDKGHVSLMVRAGLDRRYDVDERARAEAME